MLITVLFGGAVWLRGPSIGDQAATVADTVSQQVQHLWGNLQDSPLVQRLMPRLKDQAGSVLEKLFVLILATAIFLAAAPKTYVAGFLRLLPTGWRPRGHEVLDELGSTLQLWFLGQSADMLVVALLTGTGLFFLRVPLAVTLALIAGLFNFVPYIGALAGAVPALAVASAQSPRVALYVAILFLVVQTLEGNVIAPLIQKRTIDLPPALTIVSQTVLVRCSGFGG